MHAQHHLLEECKHIQVHNTPPPMPATYPDIVAVSDDDSSVHSSLYVEMSESEGGTWPGHPNVVDDYACVCDSVGPNVVEPDPDPACPVIASEGDQ